MRTLTRNNVKNVSAFNRVIDELKQQTDKQTRTRLTNEFNELKNVLPSDVWRNMHSPIKKHRSETRNEFISKKTKKNLAEFKEYMELDHLSDKDVLTIATGLALSMIEGDLISYQSADKYMKSYQNDIEFEEDDGWDDKPNFEKSSANENNSNQPLTDELDVDEYELDEARYSEYDEYMEDNNNQFTEGDFEE